MSDRNNMSNLLMGMIMGGMFALLYAPYSGEKTRSKLKNLAKDKIEDVKVSLEDRKQELEDELRHIQDKLKEQINHAEDEMPVLKRARNNNTGASNK